MLPCVIRPQVLVLTTYRTSAAVLQWAQQSSITEKESCTASESQDIVFFLQSKHLNTVDRHMAVLLSILPVIQATALVDEKQ